MPSGHFNQETEVLYKKNVTGLWEAFSYLPRTSNVLQGRIVIYWIVRWLQYFLVLEEYFIKEARDFPFLETRRLLQKN